MSAYTYFLWENQTGEYDFDDELAIGEMLAEGTVFLGGKAGPFFECEDDADRGGHAALWINCNDLWMWACADAEPLCEEDVEPLYIATCCPRRFSIIRWTCLRFQRPPMPEIIADMKTAGVWDEEMENLLPPIRWTQEMIESAKAKAEVQAKEIRWE